MSPLVGNWEGAGRILGHTGRHWELLGGDEEAQGERWECTGKGTGARWEIRRHWELLGGTGAHREGIRRVLGATGTASGSYWEALVQHWELLGSTGRALRATGTHCKGTGSYGALLGKH